MLAFLRDVLELPSIDAGGGWDIFGLPPAVIAAHPADATGAPELYLMTSDIEATVAAARRRRHQAAPAGKRTKAGASSPRSRCRAASSSGLYEPRRPRPPAP